MAVTIAVKRGELARVIFPLIVPIYASHLMLLVEEANGVEEDKNVNESGVTGVVVAHNSNNRNQFIPRQESH
eukprot:13951522-Ditylum_brightwellii.AAC.2